MRSSIPNSSSALSVKPSPSVTPSPLLVWGHAAQGPSEGLPVLDGHHVVEDGVDGGGDVVADAGDVHEVLVDHAEDGRLLEVDVAEALGVEGRPAEEEGKDDHGWFPGLGKGE